jgi:hypothetical protein
LASGGAVSDDDNDGFEGMDVADEADAKADGDEAYEAEAEAGSEGTVINQSCVMTSTCNAAHSLWPSSASVV